MVGIGDTRPYSNTNASAGATAKVARAVFSLTPVRGLLWVTWALLDYLLTILRVASFFPPRRGLHPMGPGIRPPFRGCDYDASLALPHHACCWLFCPCTYQQANWRRQWRAKCTRLWLAYRRRGRSACWRAPRRAEGPCQRSGQHGRYQPCAMEWTHLFRCRSR